jgi:hypothetical protein
MVRLMIMMKMVVVAAAVAVRRSSSSSLNHHPYCNVAYDKELSAADKGKETVDISETFCEHSVLCSSSVLQLKSRFLV